MSEGTDKTDLTTLRTSVTPDEHEAVKRFARGKMGQTIEEFVKQAVDKHLQALTGKSLTEMADDEHNRGKVIQMELF